MLQHDANSVADNLRNEAYRFDFFQAVRLLEWVVRDGEGRRGRSAPSGRARLPPGRGDRPLPRALASLGFPTGAIGGITESGPHPNPLPKGEGTETQPAPDGKGRKPAWRDAIFRFHPLTPSPPHPLIPAFPPADVRRLPGPVRPERRAAGPLYGDGYPAASPARFRAARFPRLVQPPHDLAFLSGVGEIPLHDRL